MAGDNVRISGPVILSPAISRFTSSPAFFRQAHSAIIPNTQRILLMFKPDALAHGSVPEALKLLGKSLNRENIVFRLVGLTLFNATPEMLDSIYAEHAGKGWYEQIFKPFMLGQHPHPSVVQAPLIAVMVEIKKDSRRDLVQIIRDRIIGPTDPESSPTAGTIRHELTVARGFSVWPLGDDPQGPMNNRIHCSANPNDAAQELFSIFGSGELLQTHYQPSAVETLISDWDKGRAFPQAGIVRIPLFGYLGTNPAESAAEISRALTPYRDFGQKHIESLLRELNGMQNLFEMQERLFFALTSSSVAPPLETPSLRLIRPRVIALFGAPGSGKTTIGDLLKTKGIAQAMVPLIVNEEREKEGTQEYQLLPKSEMLKMLGEGKLIGWETLSGNLYAISVETVNQILNQPGKTFIVIAGPTVIYPLREALGDRADFYQVMVSVPETELAERINARATVRDKVRGTAVSLETQRWLVADVGNFDLMVENSSGRAAEAGERIADFLLQPRAATVDSERRTSVLIGMHLYNLIELLKFLKCGTNLADINELEKAIFPILPAPLADYLMAIRNSLPALTDVGMDFSKLMADLQQHIPRVLSAGIQLRHQSFEEMIQNPKRMGRLGMTSSLERARKVYERLKAIQKEMTEEEELLFDLLHDIGKTEDIAEHQEKGYAIAKRLKLFEGWGLSSMEVAINLLAIKHSHLVGSHFVPDYSLTEVAEELAHGDEKLALANPDGSVNLKCMKMFLERICFFPCKDASGYGDGWLRVLFAEGYLNFGDWLFSIFAKHADNYDHAIAEIKSYGPTSNRDRILRFVAIEDMEADIHGRDFIYYWEKIILPQVQSSIQNGYLTEEDWNLVLNNFQHVSRIRYGITAFTDFFQFIGAKGEKIEDFNNYGNLFKLLSLITNSLLAFSKDPKHPDDFEFRFVDGNNRDIIGYDRYASAMEYLNEQLKLSTSKIISADGKIVVVPKDNKFPPRIEINEDSVSGRRTITLKLLGHLI